MRQHPTISTPTANRPLILSSPLILSKHISNISLRNKSQNILSSQRNHSLFGQYTCTSISGTISKQLLILAVLLSQCLKLSLSTFIFHIIQCSSSAWTRQTAQWTEPQV